MSALPGSGAITGNTNGRKAWLRKRAGLAVGLALAVSLPLLAQHVRIYQDGNAWRRRRRPGRFPWPAICASTPTSAPSMCGDGRKASSMSSASGPSLPARRGARDFQKMKFAATTGDQAVLDGRLWSGLYPPRCRHFPAGAVNLGRRCSPPEAARCVQRPLLRSPAKPGARFIKLDAPWPARSTSPPEPSARRWQSGLRGRH